MKINKTQFTFIVIVVTVAVVGAFNIYKNKLPAFVRIPTNPKAKGPATAPFKIVEFIDFQCPACAQGALFLKKYMTENPDKIHLEMKSFPLSMHKHAFMAARYAECAARVDKFWEFHDYLIGKQTQWKTLVDAKPAFDEMAKDLGLNVADINQCIQDPAVEKSIMDQKTEGTLRGVQSTPSYFINGKISVGYHNLMKELGVEKKEEVPH